MSNTFVVLFLFFVFNPVTLFAQDSLSLAQQEDSLLALYNSILKEPPLQRETKSNCFYEEFYTMLRKEGSFAHPFHKLNNVGKISSSDNRIRIYTWNIPYGMDDNLYFGIAQYYSQTEKKYVLVKLNEAIGTKEKSQLNTWHGTLYYEIIDTKYAGQKYYTLLGFDLHNSLSNKKRIDMMSIDEFDELYLCEKLIYYHDKLVDNIEFKYNEQAAMSLRYNKDLKMIVFDHLSPNKSSLKNNYEFYGPDFTYDALKFEKGIWVHHMNINVTN